MLGLPYLLAAAALVATLTFGIGWHYGGKLATAQYAQERIALLEQEAAKQRQLREEMAALEAKTAKIKAQRVTRWKTINQEVERVVKEPVYLDCRLTADGVRVWNSAADLRLQDQSAKDGALPADAAPTARGGYVGGVLQSGAARP